MESIPLLLFCGCLVGCVLLNVSVLYALIIGLFLFLLYGRKKQFTWKQLFPMAFSGIKTVKNILIMFVQIGILTALWRASGTIPVIICYAAKLIRPSIFVLMAFLLNCGVSFLIGTSFGTAATMGTICMTMANTLGISPALAGGAVLSGIYFGDRCSPVSTSTLLVSTLTGTNIFYNIKRLLRASAFPFLVTCVIYAVLGCLSPTSANILDVQSIFSQHFYLHWTELLPAAVILILSLFRINVKWTMLVSTLLAALCCLFLQSITVPDLLNMALTGYHTSDPVLSSMMSGGGILSMVNVGAIVCISSTYAGIFKGTGLLNHTKELVAAASRRITPYGSTVLTALISAIIACNQTLAIMLTHQLCDDLVPEKSRFAVYLANSAVVIAPLIPWSIASAVPLASISAPLSSLFFAFFLYLLPILFGIRECFSPIASQKAS